MMTGTLQVDTWRMTPDLMPETMCFMQVYKPKGWNQKSSQVTYVTMVPRVGNETLRPLGVATGNASSVTRAWRYICKNTIRWPATAHDVTTGATIIKGSPGEYIISFFVWSLRPKHGPKPRGRSVSFPTRGTMVTYVTWDVPLHGNSNCVP